MHTSTIHAPRHTEHEALHRVQKYTLLISAALSLAALMAHHPGLVALVAASTILVQIVLQRITTGPEVVSLPHAAISYRFADGGSSRSDFMEGSLPTKQSVIVIDGGSH